MGGIEWREMVDIELGVLGYDEEMWYHQVRYSQGIWGQMLDSSTGNAGTYVISDQRVGKLKGQKERTYQTTTGSPNFTFALSNPASATANGSHNDPSSYDMLSGNLCSQAAGWAWNRVSVP